MKKIITSLFLVTMMILGYVMPVSAMSYDESYETAKTYFQSLETFQSLDEIIASEAVDVDTAQTTIPQELLATDTASEVSKTIIALTLHGDDPRNYQGMNYVELLESAVHEDGAVRFDSEKNSFGSNNQIFCVNALYIIGSEKLESAANYLSSMMQNDGSFTYAGGYADLSVTGWAVETLSLVNKVQYQTTIDKAISYILSYQKDDAGFDMYGYGADANTQACVLAGLLTYDSEGVKNGAYNKNEKDPYEVLLSFQNKDGSFWSSYTGEGEYNLLATVQGVQTIGYYYHGSVYQKAQQKYLALGEKTETETETQPEITPETPQVDQEKETSSQSSQNENQPTKENVIEEKSQKADVVQTDDKTWFVGYALLLGGSGMLLWKGRKLFE